MIIHVLLVLPIALLLFSDYPCSTRSTHSSTSFQCSTRSTHSSTSFQWLSMFYSFYPYLYFFSVIIHVLLVLPIALLLFSDYPLVLPISLLLFSDYPCSTRSTHSSTSFQWLSMFYSFYPYLYFFSVIIHVLLVLPILLFSDYLYFFSVIIHVLLVLPIALLLFSDYPCSTRSTHISTSFQWLSMFYSFYP